MKIYVGRRDVVPYRMSMGIVVGDDVLSVPFLIVCRKLLWLLLCIHAAPHFSFKNFTTCPILHIFFVIEGRKGNGGLLCLH